jgi:hypothetical protein
MSTDGADSTVGNYSAGENALGQVVCSVVSRWKPRYIVRRYLQSRGNKTSCQ